MSRGESRRFRARKRRTPAELERAAAQREMSRQLRVWTPRRVFGWSLVVLAVLVGIVHWVAHLGYRPVPLSMGWQDVVIGYPAAGVLGIIAAVLLGQVSTRGR